MPEAPPAAAAAVVVTAAPPKLGTAIQLLALAITLIGALIVIGSYVGQIKDNTRRIEGLEAKADNRDQLLSQIDARTARIEGRLDSLAPSRGDGR